MKTRKKLSWKLLGDVWIHLTELHLCFVEQSINTVFQAPEKCFFGSHWGLRWWRKFHPFKTWKKLSEKLFLICEFISQTYNLDVRKQFANTLFVEFAKWDLGAHRDPWWKRIYLQIITRETLTARLLSDGWLHHTEFHPSLLGTVC